MNNDNTRIKLAVDVPEKNVVFGFETYAAALISAIMGSEPNFTIGVFGKWGTGKTTLLKKIEELLYSSYENKVLCVFFDAWRYQREQNMLLPILDTLSESLRLQRTNHWKRLDEGIKRLTQAVVFATKISVPGLEFDPKKAKGELQSVEQARSDYYNWLEKLQAILNQTRHDDPERRIVLIIDDLDRCLPGKVIEVLESIKVMLDVSGLVFILAFDPMVVEKAIENYYGTDNINGKEYIKKLVQVEFRLPPLRTQDVVRYTEILQQTITHMDEPSSQILSSIVPMVVGDNPREV